jgi:signal peptidase II
LSFEPVPILGEVLRFVLRFNTGAAFSVAWGGPMVLLVFNVVASILLCVYILRMKSTRVMLFLGLILGGALGNTIDRVFRGPVTDFIDMGIGTLRWPVFNVADIALVVGGALLLLKSGGKCACKDVGA